jgi:hypothetical protein
MDGGSSAHIFAEGIRFDGCDFGTSNGSLYTTHSGADVAWAFAHTKIIFNNCLFASTTKVSGTLYGLDEIAYQNYQRTAGLNRTDYAHGTVAQESTTVHSPATTSEKLTPTSAIRKLTTGVRYTSVNNTHSANVCAWVQKDGSYNGNAPRLMQKANPAVGISADAVLATATLTSASTWYQVCGTTATFSDNGVATTFVDVDGTAGNIFVSDWVASIN